LLLFFISTAFWLLVARTVARQASVLLKALVRAIGWRARVAPKVAKRLLTTFVAVYRVLQFIARTEASQERARQAAVAHLLRRLRAPTGAKRCRTTSSVALNRHHDHRHRRRHQMPLRHQRARTRARTPARPASARPRAPAPSRGSPARRAHQVASRCPTTSTAALRRRR